MLFSSVSKKISFLIGNETQKIIYELEEALDEFKPDVVHFHNVFPLISPVAYLVVHKREIPIIQTVHNFRFFCPNGLLLKKNGQICRREGDFLQCVTNKCFRNSTLMTALYSKHLLNMKNKKITEQIDCFLALNEFMGSYFKKRISKPEKVKIIPNFSYPVPNIEVMNSDKEYYLYLGRLSIEKGIKTMLKAFGESKADLKIAGKGPLEEEVKFYIGQNKNKNISYEGFVTGDQKYKLLKGAKALIVPSEWYENLPTNVIEAFSMGVPVIAADTGGLGTMIEHGINGLKFKMGESEDLHNVINMAENLNKDQYLVMCQNAFSSWENNYSPKVFKNRIENLYQNVVNSKKRLLENTLNI